MNMIRRAKPHGEWSWRWAQSRSWNRCHFCGGFIFKADWHFRGEEQSGYYVAHACERCHLEVYGPQAEREQPE